ncbi:MAG: HNH endonuclease [Lachnospiraceae bacterium]|nr:HNH endonuclease [Lachnospiraceae bacterium]
MVVYVINKNGQPLMPTARHGFVRRILNSGQAKVIKRCPFTIQLLYDTTNIVQPVSLGVDAGSKHVGLSATTETKELYAADVELRDNIVNLLSTRREFRNSRRHRKTRYRKPRFNNRIKSKHKGWLAPSIEAKINSHIQIVQKVLVFLPISKIVIEVASFDIQQIKNPTISGVEYQQGDQLGFWNTREYVLFRDGHVCQCCKGKSKDKRLNVHHIESRKTGGDAPNNLITLCETCHNNYHQGAIQLPKTIRRGMSFRDTVFMGIMRWELYNRLKGLYPNIVFMTYGYITKYLRITNNLPKTHTVDARCISDNPTAEPFDCIYFCKKVRCHNRQLHKANPIKGGIRKRSQSAYTIYGFHLFDKVLYNGQECFITGKRTSGSFKVATFDNTVLSAGISYKKLKLIEAAKHFITERKTALLPIVKARGIRA